MASAGDEPVPHHFYIDPGAAAARPWQLFRSLPPIWQAACVGAAAVLLSISLAALTQLHVRSDRGGWSVAFGAPAIDSAALKAELLQALEQNERDRQLRFSREIREAVERLRAELAGRSQAELTQAVKRLNAGLEARIAGGDRRVQAEAQKLVGELFQAVTQQRAEDLNFINVRFESIDQSNALKSRQYDVILGTLLDVAELRLR
jgi:hypothetical protein